MVPIYLEISGGVPCCGISWSTEILVEMGVPAAAEHQMEVKLLKFQVVSKRHEKEREYESVRFCGF